jgi:hypothetical protein
MSAVEDLFKIGNSCLRRRVKNIRKVVEEVKENLLRGEKDNGSKASSALPSDKNSARVKMLGWLGVVA